MSCSLECVHNHRIECPGHSPECCLTDEPEQWMTCEDCSGEGSIETHRPFHNDPHFCVTNKCSACGGSGWQEL